MTEEMDRKTGGRTEVNSYSGFTAILRLNRGHLAALGSLLELASASQPGAFVGDIVSYARQRFPAVDDDLFDSAEGLADFGIAAVVSNEQDSVVAPHSLSAEANIALVGRIAAELGRVPIRSLPGELLRGVLIPTYGNFHEATLGPGYADLTALARELVEREWERSAHVVTQHRYPGLILRPRLGNLELAGMVNFETEADRDLALESIIDRSASMVFGEPWNVDEVYEWPQPEPLQDMRFAGAASLLTGVAFNQSFAPREVPGLALVETVAEELEITVRYWETIAGLATDLERAVLGLNRSRGTAFFSGGTDLIWAEVLGRHGAVDLGEWTGKRFGLEVRKVIDRGLRLGPGERVTTIHYRSSATPKNPLPELIKDTTKALKSFNSAQRTGLRLRVPYDPATIQDLIITKVEQRRADAKAIVAAGLFADPGRPLGRKIFMVATPDQTGRPGTTGRFRDGSSTDLITYEFETAGADEVHFASNDSGRPVNFMNVDAFEEVFGQAADGDPIVSGHSSLFHGLETLLGTPVTIEYPDTQ